MAFYFHYQNERSRRHAYQESLNAHQPIMTLCRFLSLDSLTSRHEKLRWNKSFFFLGSFFNLIMQFTQLFTNVVSLILLCVFLCVLGSYIILFFVLFYVHFLLLQDRNIFCSFFFLSHTIYSSSLPPVLWLNIILMCRLLSCHLAESSRGLFLR